MQKKRDEKMKKMEKTKSLNKPPKIPFKYLGIATQVLPILGTLFAVILAIFTGIGWMEISLLMLMHFLVMGSGEIGAHRMFTHRAFKAHKSVSAVFCALASMATQGPVLYWVMHHRLHHQYSDTEKDPHSPHVYPGAEKRGLLHGLFRAHFSWIYDKDTVDLSYNEIAFSNEARRLVAHTKYPNIVKISNCYWFWILLGVAIPALIGGLWMGTWLGALKGGLWGGIVRIFIGQHATWGINSCSHHFGTRDFECRDRSTNNWLFAMLTWGNWHNNHHAFPSSARTGLKWWQVDIAWWIILSLEKLGLVYNVKRP
jgi:stearoyl-CoA desaturase (delta-9 desaturase)